MKEGNQKVTSFKVVRKGKKKGVLVTYSKQYSDDTGAVITVDAPSEFHAVEPHRDLKNLFDRLSMHYAALTEREKFKDASFGKDEEVQRCVGMYPVGSVQWKEGKNYVGVMMHGHKVLSTGHACNSLTRLVTFNDEDSNYDFADQLEELTDSIRDEVVLLLSGKHAPPAQTSITDADQQEVEEEVEEQA